MDLRPRILAIAIVTFTAVNALADSCSPVDLRPSLGAPRDQGDTGWCFANTAADLLSVKLKKRISAYDLAISHHLTDLKKLENTKSTEVRELLRSKDVMARIQEERVGDADDPSAPYLKRENFLRATTKDGSMTHYGLIDMGGSEDVAILLGQERGFCLASQLEGSRGDADFHRRVTAYHRGRRGQPISRDFHDYGIATDPETRRMAESVVRYADSRCQPRIHPQQKFAPYTRMYGKGVQDFRRQVAAGRVDRNQAQKEIWGDIDKLLDSGEATTIGYDAYDVMERDKDPGGRPEEHGDHSSVIAGRKMLNGSCHYFLRNSWGKDCSIYTGSFKGRCDRNAGGVWVKKSELPSLYSVVSLSKPRSSSSAVPMQYAGPESSGRD